MEPLYTDIVLPLAQEAFSYRVGEALRNSITEGRCVKVQLGHSKLYTGIVWRLHDRKPPYKTIKEVDSYVENAPMLSPLQMRFWEWLAEYYMCTLGEVMRAALPSALKPEGFSAEEFARDMFRPRSVQYVRLHPDLHGTEALNDTFESLKRATKQYAALVELVANLPEERLFEAEILRSQLSAETPILQALVKKKIILLEARELAAGELPPLPERLPALTPAQTRAMQEIGQGFATHEVVLLHGVTGSGKTEIYIRLIDQQLRQGRNVLYLLPEIAMTSQLVERIRSYFGERVIPYHSRFPERTRVERYLRANRSRGGELILGVRSSLFLPINDLGLVIVDEEHDTSYKQTDTAPRYQARDCAVVLARLAGAKTLLGSATPSLESWANATEGKYGLVSLTERYGGALLPQMIISDTMRAVQRGERNVHFNKALTDRIAAALTAGEQVMLFQNRRGFSPYVECGTCGWVASCPHCNVTLTFHKADGMLRCHYCGYALPLPPRCPACGQGAVESRGFGTEKVEEEITRLFPSARIARLDRDTMQNPSKFRAIITAFTRHESDILVGTQIITKGFDFGGVSLVGILNADNLLNYPDFRAAERAFQLMVQAAGRAGRRQRQGEVVIQTSMPEHPLIRQVAAGDYLAMARRQLAERSAFFYPPYCRMVGILLRHRDKMLLWRAANRLGDDLRGIFGRRLLGPQPPPVDRIREEFLVTFLLKVERSRSFAQAKVLLAEAIARLHGKAEFRSVTVVCNVDPQ